MVQIFTFFRDISLFFLIFFIISFATTLLQHLYFDKFLPKTFSPSLTINFNAESSEVSLKKKKKLEKICGKGKSQEFS